MHISQGDTKHVAEILYGNSSAVALSVAANQTDFGIALEMAVDPLIKGGRVKILSDSELNMTNGYMIMMPEGTPVAVVEWYEREFGRAINNPDFQRWAKDNHITVYPSLATDKAVKSYLKALKTKIKVPQ